MLNKLVIASAHYVS